MRILVYGAGAIGSLVGALLAKAGHDVTLLCREDHARAIAERGLKVEGLTAMIARPDAMTRFDHFLSSPVDLVILTTKAYDTDTAGAEIARLTPVPVLSLQNGLDNHSRLARHLGMDRVYLGTTSIGVTFLGPGRVRHAGAGATKIGEPTMQADATSAKMIARLFTEAGLPAEYSSSILSDVWKKGVVNNAINPLTAILRRENGVVADDEGVRALALSLAFEAEEVATKLGYDVKGSSLLALRVAEETRANRSSMLQDVERGRRTEIDSITGVIVREARGLGVATPRSEVMLALVKAIAAGGRVARTASSTSSSPLSRGRGRTRARSASARRKR